MDRKVGNDSQLKSVAIGDDSSTIENVVGGFFPTIEVGHGCFVFIDTLWLRRLLQPVYSRKLLRHKSLTMLANGMPS